MRRNPDCKLPTMCLALCISVFAMCDWDDPCIILVILYLQCKQPDQGQQVSKTKQHQFFLEICYCDLW